MVMGSSKEIGRIEPKGEIYVCPACGYTDGFHVSFLFKEENSDAEVYLICPKCHSRFKIGWKVDMCAMVPAFTQYVPMLSKKAGFSADGMYCTGQTPMVAPDSPIDFVRKWWKRHQAWYGKPPQQQTAIGYSVINAFTIAAEKAGRNLTRETLIEALETFKDVPDPFGGPSVTYTKTRRLGADRVFMSRIQGGKFVILSDLIDYRE